MSAAAAPPVDAGAAPPAKKGKKKLIIMLAAVLLVLGAAGGGAVFYMKKKASTAAEAAEEEGGTAHQAHKVDPKHPPTFVPLDPFVVNLADRDADRYAQIGITLELDDAKFADQFKAFMPAIRNGILMVLAHKTSQELLARSGKEALAAEILREAVRPLGIEVPDGPDASAKAAHGTKSKGGEDSAKDDEDDDPKAKGKAKTPKHESEPNPVRRVHFSNFIIQ